MKISVIIPSYNRPDALGRCLESFVGQSLSLEDFEVIVVDDGSEQPLDDVLNSVDQRLSVKLVRQRNQGPASARNRGVTEACGEFIAFTDDDCQVDRHWLSSFEGRLKQEPDLMLGGQTVNQLKENLCSETCQTLIDYLYEYHERTNSDMRFFTTNNVALSRQSFMDTGGFDEGFPDAGGEDREFCDRWLHSGRSVEFLPAALVYHSHELSLTGFCKLHYRYGKAATRYWETRSARKQKRFNIEFSGFYSRLVIRPWQIKLTSPFRQSMLLVISQLTGALGYFSGSLSRR